MISQAALRNLSEHLSSPDWTAVREAKGCESTIAKSGWEKQC